MKEAIDNPLALAIFITMVVIALIGVSVYFFHTPIPGLSIAARQGG
jgi:uncharacterized membrane protein